MLIEDWPNFGKSSKNSGQLFSKDNKYILLLFYLIVGESSIACKHLPETRL